MNIGLFIMLSVIAFISFSLYIVTLVNFVMNGSLNVLLLLITVGVNIITTFLMQYNLPKRIKNSIVFLNLENKSNVVSNFCSLILLSFLGIALTANTMFNEYNLLNFMLGILIIIVSLFEYYMFIFSKQTLVMEVLDVEKHDESKYHCVSLINDEYGMLEYYTEDVENIKMEHSYHCVINKFTKRVLSIKNEVIDVK